MGDVGETFKMMKDQNKEKRASNRGTSAEILKARGFLFDVRNHGAHLIVWYLDGAVDFWPGTGKWIVRDTKKIGRGVFSLVKFISKAGNNHGND